MKIKTLMLAGLLALAPLAVMPVTAVYAAPENVTVEFYLDDGRTLIHETQTIPAGTYASIPTTPLKNGSMFKYWETTTGDKFSFATKIENDLVLVAEWHSQVVFYTVTFKVGDEVVSTQEVKEGSSAIAPTVFDCPAGKTFSSWDNISLDNIQSNLTINAVLEDATYTIDVIGFEGTVVDTIDNIAHGQTLTLDDITLPLAPEHYQFDGIIGSLENITADGQIELVYKPVEYKVSFMQGEEEITSSQVAYGQKVPFPPVAPQKDNYIFVGWFENLSDETMYTFNEQLAGPLTLHAKFIAIEKPKFSVTFHGHDGSVYGAVQQVEEGQAAITPGAPYREGYEFVKWVQDFSCITANLDVYPQYKIKTFAVTFMDGDTILKTIDVLYGQNIAESAAPAAPEKEGQEFITWDRNLKNITADTTISAVYRQKTYVVMFLSQNGLKIGLTQYVQHGSSATAPTITVEQGYRFVEWRGEQSLSSITADCTFVAVVEKLEYQVNFYEGADLVFTATLPYGSYAPYYAYEKTGYIFDGWYISESADATKFNFAQAVSANTNLYAKWVEKPAVTYTVTFTSENTTFASQIVAEGQSAVSPGVPQKEGHTFTGWLDALGAPAVFENITQNTTFVAAFKANTYAVTFKYGEGLRSRQMVEYQSPATAPTENLDKTGFKFVGWDKEFSSITADTIVTALYEAEAFSVTFKSGEDVLSVQNVQFGAYAQMPATPEKEGHTFTGWQTEGGDVFAFDAPISESVTVVAAFTVNSYDVYYFLNGLEYEVQTHQFGTALTALPAPEFDEEEQAFSGWSTLPETMPAGLVKIYGTLKTYYYVSYYASGTLFDTQKVLEGAAIPALEQTPNLGKGFTFGGWEALPTTMPSQNITVSAIAIPVELEKNIIELALAQTAENTYALTMTLTGDVLFAGILGALNLGDVSIVDITCPEDFADANFDAATGLVYFVLSCGINFELDDQWVVTVEFTAENFTLTTDMLEIDAFKVLTEDGTLVDTEYSVKSVAKNN